MISGSIRIDLAGDPDDWLNAGHADRRALEAMRMCPDGARVIVDIGNRWHVTDDAIGWLHEHQQRLDIEIQGADPAAVAKFVRAARAGTWRGIFA